MPSGAEAQKVLAKFDWAAKSRVVEDGGAGLAGVVLVLARSTPGGVRAQLDLSGPPEVTHELARWGVELSRAAGASLVQVWAARGHGDALKAAGLQPARPWWRMDRGLTDTIPVPEPVAGYVLTDGTRTAGGAWEATFSRSFADHWRYAPRLEEEILAGKAPGLCLMALTTGRREPAAMALGQVETYVEDSRPQPVGLVSAVGTVPEHRRRGLATWLVAEVLRRLRDAGARHASLYVDGMSHVRAFDVYRKLGFELAFEAEVWEATLP